MKLLNPDEYQFEVEGVFLQMSDALHRALPTARIEHVGASSIRGAVSKGDVDICVVVDPIAHEGAVSALEGMGYTVKPDTLRTSELCMLQSARQDIDIALQVVAEGSKFEFFMAFRDALRKDPALVAVYNGVKLAHQNLSEEEYRAAKAEFIEAVLRSA